MSHITRDGSHLFCVKSLQNQSHSSKKRIPSLIASALLLLQSNQQVSFLSRSTRDVLAYLVKLTDLEDPQTPIFAFKRTIAKKTLLSESSVYRALNELVKNEYIKREKQERKSRNGRLSCARISLSNSLCLAIGLSKKNINLDYIEEKAESVTKNRIKKENILSPSVNLTDGHVITNNKTLQSLKKHSSITLKTYSSEKSKPYSLRTKVPEEFLWLIKEKNISKPQIFLLMREFSKRKQRLSDVVELIKDRIKELPISDIFRYLRALAKAPTDFAWIKKQRKNEKSIIEKNKIEQSTRDKFLITWNRRFLKGKNTVHQIDATVRMAQVWLIDEDNKRLKIGYIPINYDYMKLLKTARLHPIEVDKAKDLIRKWQSI